VVSVANQCRYCTQHHAEALHVFWKDELKVSLLVSGKTDPELTEIDNLWIEYAKILTLTPAAPEMDILVANLKKAGADDRSVLDATLVIGYFNFVNRIILGLGVELEEDGGKGYKYN
jgi:uncharacterized peroxidase-related enzyme